MQVNEPGQVTSILVQEIQIHVPHIPIAEVRLLDAHLMARKRRMAQRRKFCGRQDAEISQGREEPIVVGAECILPSEGQLCRAGSNDAVR